MNERLEKIKEIIVERDKHKDEDGEIDYPMYDQSLYELNDYGHIDWMVDKIGQQQKELDHLNNMPLIHEYIRMRDQLSKEKEENKRLRNENQNIKLKQYAYKCSGCGYFYKTNYRI